jgi:transketolase
VRARVAVEAGCPLGWERFVGLDGEVLGISRFGASAPGSLVLEKLGISVSEIIASAKRVLRGMAKGPVVPRGESQ